MPTGVGGADHFCAGGMPIRPTGLAPDMNGHSYRLPRIPKYRIHVHRSSSPNSCGILTSVNTISKKTIWLLLGIAALCIVAIGVWPRISAWRSSTQGRPAPAPGELAFQGSLSHNWNGAISGNCDFRFQLWDADINGSSFGEAVEVDKVGVRSGTFGLAIPAARLGEAELSSWLAVGVRCGDEEEWETLAPRMQHQAIALAGAAAAGFEIPEAAALVCSVPAADGTDSAGAEHEPVIAGVNYRLEGGFRTATVAGGVR